MRRRATRTGFLVTIVAGAWLLSRLTTPEPSHPLACQGDGWIAAGHECLRFASFRSRDASEHPTLVVALHGDSPTSNPSYQYDWARQAARENADLVAVGLLRPGYQDRSGHSSSGMRGKTNGDNYTPAVIDTIALAITHLQQMVGARRTVIAGHSGGAAIAAAIMGRHPNVADAALLVSCPCDVARWREHMRKASGNAIWDEPVVAVSPTSVANTVNPGVRIVTLVGHNDRVTPPFLTRAYDDLLRGRAIGGDLIEIDGGHDIFFDRAVLAALRALLLATA